MKILEIGTFDDYGSPTGWTFAPSLVGRDETHCCMCLTTDGSVFIGGNQETGVEITEWTKARRSAKFFEPT